MRVETQQELLERALKAQQSTVDKVATRDGRPTRGYNYTELAKDLGISRQAISQFRYGAPMSTDIAMRLAKISKDDPEYVVACVEYSKALRLGRHEELTVWEKLARLTKRVRA